MSHLRSVLLLPLFAAACATAPVPEAGTRLAIDVPSLCAAAPQPTAPSNATAASSAAAGAAAPQQMTSSGRNQWRPGEAALTGYFGAGFHDLTREGGSIGNNVDDDATVPMLGGGAQWKLAGENVDFGVEALLGFGWAGDVAAFAVGGGGAAVAVDVDLFVFELYGGPFLSLPLGDRMRLYGGAGPMLEWGFYEQHSAIAAVSGDGSGFGAGWYARTGLEFAVGSRSMVGVGVRWSDVTMDLSGGLGDLDVDGLLAMVTFTQGF